MSNFFTRIFKKWQKPAARQVKKQRSFKNARNNRFTQWLNATFAPINYDLKQDLIELIKKSRDLAKNNEIFRSYLTVLQKSVIGAEGFRLKSYVKLPNGKLSVEQNNQLEIAWWKFGKKSNGYLSKSGLLGDIDFDKLVLRTLLIDGEVFIHVDRNADNPYGISFEIIDTLRIDSSKNQIGNEFQNAIVLGVQIDKHYKPVQYWIKEGNSDVYQCGKQYAIPAKDIIHIYKQEFIDQTRGFSDICSSIGSLKQLDDYYIAELIQAKISSCLSFFYERNGSDTAGDFIDQNDQQIDDQGTFITELSPGEGSIVPQGYSVKSVSPTHPNGNFSGFVKAIVRRVAASLGISYNRINGDYEAINYSSLREASIDEKKTYNSVQRFLIQNWKDIEYEEFVKSYLINYPTSKLSPVKLNQYLTYNFLGRRDPLFDQAKEIIAIQRKLKLGLTSQIKELEQRGLDPDQVLDEVVRWKEMCQRRGLNFADVQPVPLDVVEQYNEQASNPEVSDK